MKNIPPKSTKKPLMELISDYSKVTGDKVNIQKSIDFLSTSNEQLELKIQENISTKKKGVSLTKYVQYLNE